MLPTEQIARTAKFEIQGRETKSGATVRAGDRTYQQTYPVASQLCAKVAAGTEGKHLKRFAATVSTDCTTLQSGFVTAQTTVLAARTAITAQITADRAVMSAACPATAKVPSAVCIQTRKTESYAITVLQHQQRTAARHFYKTVETNRDHFWKAIRSLAC